MSSSSSEEEEVIPLSKGREKRVNAGNKMGQMLDAEEDDFYKSTYGGFEEEEHDNEYQESVSDSDAVDSDFSIDENDEVVSADEDENGVKRTRGRLVTKAYQEPKRKAPPKKVVKKKAPVDPDVVVKKTVPRKRIKIEQDDSFDSFTADGRKSFRSSTQQKTEETKLRHRIAAEEQQMRKKRSKSKVKHRQWTQDELLKEAKKTEAENIKSLEKYRKLELEKAKKSKLVKKGIQGPFVKFISTSMPLIEDITDEKLDDDSKEAKRCERSFVIFSDEALFNETFKERPAPVPVKPVLCPISNAKARYFDPVTQLPYSSASTFKALREAYCKQLELIGDVKQPEIASWIKWRKEHCKKPDESVVNGKNEEVGTK
ncbi:Vacuolar protein sorting-associated protein 72 -like protein [Halotydeus destructor]|nr:Vacuolar protein sorting-associated protein 72 -like protein [Halotydeus destructor]